MMCSLYSTSLNQVPAIVKKYKDDFGTNILNYGCGRGWRKVEDYLVTEDPFSKIVYAYDKYGDPSLTQSPVGSFDSIIVANVLNVNAELSPVIRELYNYSAPENNRKPCKVYISIYEGDKSGIGKVTTKGYQRNEKAIAYMLPLQEYFNSVTRKGNFFICENERI